MYLGIKIEKKIKILNKIMKNKIKTYLFAFSARQDLH